MISARDARRPIECLGLPSPPTSRLRWILRRPPGAETAAPGGKHISSVSLAAVRSARQRIGPQLEAHDLGQRALAALDVERRAIDEGRPKPAALPAAVRVVDADMHRFGIVEH